MTNKSAFPGSKLKNLVKAIAMNALKSGNKIEKAIKNMPLFLNSLIREAAEIPISSRNKQSTPFLLNLTIPDIRLSLVVLQTFLLAVIRKSKLKYQDPLQNLYFVLWQQYNFSLMSNLIGIQEFPLLYRLYFAYLQMDGGYFWVLEWVMTKKLNGWSQCEHKK